MIKIRDLQYLLAIDEHRHFGKAASSCFVSQPTLSGQIMKLEQQLGLTLVERQTRKVMLTSKGEQLIHQARLVLQAAENFESSAKTLLDPLSGDLHIGLIPTLAPYLLPHIMEQLNQKLPNIKFFLHEDKTHHLLSKLENGTLDFLILPLLDGMDKFECYDLFKEPFILATAESHSLANNKHVALSDLASHNILTLEDGHCLRDQAMGYCFTAGANEDTSFRATSLETLRYMVASGVGLTLLPELAALNRQQEAGVSYIPFSEPKPNRKISLLLRKGYSKMECAQEVITTVKSAIKNVL